MTSRPVVSHIRTPLLAALLVSLPVVATAQTAPWPQFRGPGSRGVAAGDALPPDRWSATDNVAWTRDIPGRGWSSPVVAGDRVFLTTVVNTGETEAAKKGLYFGGERPKPAESVHQWRVLCLDLATGAVVWEKQVHEGVPKTPIHIKSSYASETPVTDGKHVWCMFGSVGIWCLDLDGTVKWNRPLPPRAMRFGWGAAASPALADGVLYVVDDNEEQSELVALDAATGAEKWKTARDEKSNWSTPFVWKHPLRTEIVTPGTGAVRSYDLDGNLLWSLKGMSSITIATPFEADGLLYVTSGYILDPRKPIYCIKPGAAGDISLVAGETSNPSIAWSQPAAAPYNPSTLVADGKLWVLFDRGFLACHDAATGAAIYPSQRLPEGRAFTASPWYSAGKVFCLNEDGVTFVCDGGREFKILHTNALAEDDMGMATPAIVGERLLLRTSARVYCIAPQGRAATPAGNRPATTRDHLPSTGGG
ncbi:MAG: PQQ-binding-like beta-propeller repeat protein [Planctomycetaceae bacterium]